MSIPANAHNTAKHTLTLLVPLYDALKLSAAKMGLEPNEVIVNLIADYTIDDGTLDEYTRKRFLMGRELINQVVEVARRRCREGKFAPTITLDAIGECTDDPAWAATYREYVEDDIYKHGNPLKAINREFGFRVRAAIGGRVKKDDNGKPINVKVTGAIIQSYTLMDEFDKTLV